MELPKSAVLRCLDRTFLDASGQTTSDREEAVRLTPADAVRFIWSFRATFDDPLRGLSVEECPKRERRHANPLGAQETQQFFAAVTRRRAIATATKLIRQAECDEASARHYRAEAVRILKETE